MYAEDITQETSGKEVLENEESLQNLDESATQNIRTMLGEETGEGIFLEKSKSFGGSRCNVNPSLHHGNNSPEYGGENVEFVANLTKHYAGREEIKFRKNQVGGYEEQMDGEHFTKGYLSEIGESDSFVSRRKNELLRKYDNFPPSSGGRKKISNASVDGPKIRSRQESDNTNSSESLATEDLRLTTVTSKVGSITSNLRDETFSDNWRTEDFKLTSVSENKVGGRRKIRKPREKSEEESLSSSIFDDDNESSLERVRRRRRVYNPEVDELYKSFLQKIMDHLGVDEENARIYRSAIKYYIGQENPELRKRENDEIRIKEMEKIISDKDKLEEFISSKNINIEDVKRNMEKQREEREKRRREFREKRQQKEKSEADKSNEITEEKPKKSKRKTKVAENGYLESDELIFSPGN